MNIVNIFITAWVFFSIGHLAAFYMFRNQLKFPGIFPKKSKDENYRPEKDEQGNPPQGDDFED